MPMSLHVRKSLQLSWMACAFLLVFVLSLSVDRQETSWDLTRGKMTKIDGEWEVRGESIYMAGKIKYIPMRTRPTGLSCLIAESAMKDSRERNSAMFCLAISSSYAFLPFILKILSWRRQSWCPKKRLLAAVHSLRCCFSLKVGNSISPDSSPQDRAVCFGELFV